MPRVADRSDGVWEIDGVPPDQAYALLERNAPWRMQLNFTGGPSSKDFETFEPFNRRPLRKLRLVLEHLDVPPNPVILDIGHNCGYNSLYMAGRHGATATGIDVVRRHNRLANELAHLIETDIEFLLEDAQSFCRESNYDLVLHFGTLYHLPNPILSIEHAARSLRPGGWLALETTRYVAQADCAKWIYGRNGDQTNFWALGDLIIEETFARCGLTTPQLIANATLPRLGSEMDRATWIAQKLPEHGREKPLLP